MWRRLILAAAGSTPRYCPGAGAVHDRGQPRELRYAPIDAATSLGQRIRQVVRSLVAILPFDEAAAEHYGKIRAQLEPDGRRVEDPDVQIAAIGWPAI
jgi:hypothetical protein